MNDDTVSGVACSIRITLLALMMMSTTHISLWSSTLSNFANVPSPPYKKVLIDTKQCGRVLTASENLKWIKEKRKAKENKKQKKSKHIGQQNPDSGNHGYL